MPPLTLEAQQLLSHIQANSSEVSKALVFMIIHCDKEIPCNPELIYCLYQLIDEMKN